MRTPYRQVTLTTGEKRHVLIQDWGHGEKALLAGQPPFDEWTSTVEGSYVHRSQIVEARRVDLDQDAMQELHNQATGS